MKMIVVAAALMLAGAAQAEPPRDWAALLRADAQAFHDAIAADHPGPYNRIDPAFAKRNDAALAVALERARAVRDYPGYFWAMRGYVASFDDGHVQYGTIKGSPMLTARWPGFLTGLDAAGRQVVLARAEDASVPLGAVLVGCDGVAADMLLARNVGAFVGRWSLLATRQSRAGRLFVDSDNPFIQRPAQCRFAVGGAERNLRLVWRPLLDPEWSRRLDETYRRQPAGFGAHALADGTRWFQMTSFDGNPDGPVAKALNPMIAGMRADRPGLLEAPAIVLDVRGNGGGSSQWSEDIAKVLWGEAAVAAAERDATYVEWRASKRNLATMEQYRDAWSKSADASPEALAWARRNAAGMAAALAKGQPLWRSDDEPEAAKPAASVTAPTRPIYVLTDAACASACLDAVDLWTKLGAVQIGQETSADTLYMDVGERELPSGIAMMGVPMKVFRGRPRGSNVPAVPRYRYTGDLTDTASVERWILGLPRR